MTCQRLQQADRAKQWLAKANEESDRALRSSESNAAPLPWNRRMTLSLLRREAEELVGKNQSSSVPADSAVVGDAKKVP
jgi:hypothetical protein